MAIVNPVGFLQNRNDHPARIDRLAASALLTPDGAGLTWREGVRGDLDFKVSQRGAGANMSVDIAAGMAYVKQDNSGQGCYVVPNDAVINQAIATSDPTNPRRDLICIQVEDAFFTGSNNQGVLTYVQGIAAASPVDPSVPANTLILARVTVAAAAASIVDANITDLRPKIAALGGIHTVADNTERDALAATFGRTVWNIAAAALETYNGTSWKRVMNPPRVDLSASAATNITPAGTFVKVALASTDYIDTDYFSVTGSVITVLQAGLYNIDGQSLFSSGAATIISPAVIKNNTNLPHASPDGLFVAETSVGGVRGFLPLTRQRVALAANDTLQMALAVSGATGNTTHTVGTRVARLQVIKVD